MDNQDYSTSYESADGFAVMEDILQVDKRPNWIGALLLGIAAAVVSSLIWYVIVVVTNYEVGFVAIVVGAIIGVAVKFGSGSKTGVALGVMALVITLVAMLVSEYLIIREVLIQAMVAEGFTEIEAPLLMPVADMVELIQIGIEESPTTLLYWGIAAFAAFSIPGRRSQLGQKAPPAADPAP